MALEILKERKLTEKEKMERYLVTEDLYLNKDKTRLVGETDPEVAYFLAAKGQFLLKEVALQYGLIEPEAEVQPEPEGEPEPQKEEQEEILEVNEEKDKETVVVVTEQAPVTTKEIKPTAQKKIKG